MSEPTKEQLENVKKFPWQWAIYVLLAAVSFMYGQNLLKDKRSEDDCDKRAVSFQKALSKKDSTIFDWQARYINLSNELLYKNNILDRQQQVIDQTDSIARKKFEKPAKQIVKDHE